MSDYMHAGDQDEEGRGDGRETAPPDQGASSQTAKPAKPAGGKRKDPGVRHHDWLASRGPASDARRMDALIDFSDWMRGVNPLFDRNLPACWINHPWLVLCVDALYDEWLMSYRHKGDSNTPRTFLEACEATIRRVGEWSKSCGLLEPGHTCAQATTVISPERAAARGVAREEGWSPRYAHAWPYGEAAAEHMMDLTASPPGSDPAEDPFLGFAPWREASGADPWNNGADDPFAPAGSPAMGNAVAPRTGCAGYGGIESMYGTD